MNLVAVTSGKGGVGKSCVSAYTGAALAESGQRVLLIEQGMNAKSLDTVLGAQQAVVFDLSDVMAERCDPHKAIVTTLYHENLKLMPCSAERYTRPHPQKFSAMLYSLRNDFDYIIIDGADFTVIAPQSYDAIWMVTTPDSLSIRACESQARWLYEVGVENLRLVINNVPSRVIPIQGAVDFDDVIDLVGVQLIGVVPSSPKLQYSSNNAQRLDEESVTVQIFANLAARLQGQDRPLIIR